MSHLILGYYIFDVCVCLTYDLHAFYKLKKRLYKTWKLNKYIILKNKNIQLLEPSIEKRYEYQHDITCPTISPYDNHIDGQSRIKTGYLHFSNCSGESKNFRISLFFILFFLFHNIMYLR